MKYDLVCVNGNAWSVMGYVARAMKNEGMSREEVSAYRADAMSGDYNHLLCVSIEMIDKCNERAGDTEED